MQSGFHISWVKALESEILGTWVTLSLCASFPPTINRRSLLHFLISLCVRAPMEVVFLRWGLPFSLAGLNIRARKYSLGNNVSLSLCFSCLWPPPHPLHHCLNEPSTTENSVSARNPSVAPYSSQDKGFSRWAHKEAQWKLTLGSNDAAHSVLLHSVLWGSTGSVLGINRGGRPGPWV